MSNNRPQGPPPGHNDYENQQGLPFAEPPKGLESYDEAFKVEKPKFNDIFFALFFLVVVAGFVAISGITLNAMKHVYGVQGGSIYTKLSSFTFNSNTAILFGFVVAASVVLSFLLILFARLNAKLFITSGLILNVILGLGTAIFYFVEHYYSAAIVFLVFTLISAWSYWSCRSRIPFSATVLEITIDVMKRYKSTLVTSFIGIVISGAFSAFFLMVVVATYMKYSPDSSNPGCHVDGGSCSKGKLIGVLVFVFFAGYYISEVIKNLIHVTIAGVYGTWYYLANSDQGEPKHPALGALKRAVTYCFGSICFGSLIVSIIQLIRGLVQILRSNAMGDGDLCAGCGYLILDFIIGIIEWMVRYFNHYAYIYIALYGKPYITSARETFQLIRFKGMDALINDCFVNTSLHLYALLVAYIATLFAYLYLKFTKPEYNSDGGYYTPVLAFTFLIAGQITRIALTVIESGISTFFVALARDPEVFQMTNRDRFDEIFRNYPQVLEKIFSKEEQQQQLQQQQNLQYYQQPAQYGRY